MERITAASLRAANKAFILPPVPHIEDRIAEMRAIADDIEHAIVIDWNTGDVLWRSSSKDEQSGSVDISPAHEARLTVGNLIIHTHPGPAELSIDDAICVNSCEARGNMAVCADGTVSWCDGVRVGPIAYHLNIRSLAMHARAAYRIDAESRDPIEIARDNWVIHHAAAHVGWLKNWYVRYSDALIAAMPQGE